jgi:succinate dehydrogenase / fumarate reductase flavoprotein subunit
VWVPKSKGDTRKPKNIPEEERDYYLERRYPSFGNLVPRDVASRAAKVACDSGHGVGMEVEGQRNAVYLDFAQAIGRDGKQSISERYGNLFDMYERITGESPYETPMRIYPAVHYTMGGLWVDYNLMSNLPGLHVLGEANFSDHGANRLGASALMQGLADGYFVIPYTLGNYIATQWKGPVDTDAPEFDAAEKQVREQQSKLLAIGGDKPVDHFHRRLGKIMWEYCGMERTREGLETALKEIPALREEFWSDVLITGEPGEVNLPLEKAGRVADFLEFAEVMCNDALQREESCGGHFRGEHRTEEGEARRDDENFSYGAVWEYQGVGETPTLHKEPLEFEHVKLTTRSYK